MLSLNVALSIALWLFTFIARLYIINRYKGSCIKGPKMPEIAFKLQQCFCVNIGIDNDVDVYFEVWRNSFHGWGVIACWDLLLSLLSYKVLNFAPEFECLVLVLTTHLCLK